MSRALTCVVVFVHDKQRRILAVHRSDLKGLALPGGMHDEGETWQEAGAREVFEETGVRIDSSNWNHFNIMDIVTVKDRDTINIIFVNHYVEELFPDQFVAQESEVDGVLLITEAVDMVFPTHTHVVKEFFDDYKIIDEFNLNGGTA